MDIYQRRRLVALSAIAAVFIVFVLLIRSCGGDDTPTTVSPVAGATGLGGATALSQADYVDQGDQICLQANTSLAGVDTSAPTADSDQSEIISGELEQLQSLPPPEEGTSDLDDFFAALDKLAKGYHQRALAVDRGDTSAASEIDTTIDATAADAAAAADSFGFKVCGDPSQVGGDTSGSSGDSTTTDTGGTVTPPATTTPVVPTTPPADTGATPTAPSDGGTDSSGGVSP
jgi:hypothetical protein